MSTKEHILRATAYTEKGETMLTLGESRPEDRMKLQRNVFRAGGDGSGSMRMCTETLRAPVNRVKCNDVHQ